MTCMIMMGDCRQRMAELPAGYAQTCVTSPPYFGLRSYLPGVVKLRDDLPDDVKDVIRAELTALGVPPIMDE